MPLESEHTRANGIKKTCSSTSPNIDKHPFIMHVLSRTHTHTANQREEKVDQGRKAGGFWRVLLFGFEFSFLASSFPFFFSPTRFAFFPFFICFPMPPLAFRLCFVLCFAVVFLELCVWAGISACLSSGYAFLCPQTSKGRSCSEDHPEWLCFF